MTLEEITAGAAISGILPDAPVTVLAMKWHGPDALEVTYRATGGPSEVVLYRHDEPRLSPSASGRPFDADPADYKLAAEAQRIQLAGLFDPMLAVATSDVQPLPHQIRAVYGELLPRTPLRFLLADDPGAGKTIMAGLYIKELLLRDDVTRCLVVAPGGLVEQWQDELALKFGLAFDILTTSMVEASISTNVFDRHPLLIARMDQLSRNEDLQALLEESEWDLIVVDEAHRMGAHYFGGKLEKTKRYVLGELLGRITRHLLLMTATPHSGIEENFQLFLRLLDKDRFEGKSKGATDTTGVMRRLVKEELLTFEGKKLFPERVAETVPYELTPLEEDLYKQVTDYVRTGMNRAEKLSGTRRNTVGFALTVLQRRLASSPEAIYKSLQRRAARLERRRAEILDGTHVEDAPTVDLTTYEDDDLTASETEEMEDAVLDAATAAQTVEELEAELLHIARLIEVAQRVRSAGSDRKWSELSAILQDNALTTDDSGRPRKLIVFTEHRDTLDYLQGRIASLLGRPGAVRAIHGGVNRVERRRITGEFTKNPDCQVLLATDAAGEGLNLQAAHLMVNYDLPWNPNRIEQRFGRIHRIGQTEVCRLWNLVADNTREGEVFIRLLAKLEQMSTAYGGRVFDVLGEAFKDQPLRTLLLDAIRYGERPDVRARMFEVVDQHAGEGLKELIEERALAADVLTDAELKDIRARMDDARARRLAPHYIELAFVEAFKRLSGRMPRREAGRFEITNVPPAIRAATRLPVATRYERVTFDLERVQPEGLARADLLAPGHPLHDAVMGQVVDTLGAALARGTVLVSPTAEEPRLLVGVEEEIRDATGDPVARRFGYAFVAADGSVEPAGPAPYLDCVGALDTEAARGARRLPWLASAEQAAASWIISHELPEYVAEVQPQRAAELDRMRALVTARLTGESERLAMEAMVAREKELSGGRPQESSGSLKHKAVQLEQRLATRLDLLDRQRSMAPRPPVIRTAALVLPLGYAEGDLPADAPVHAVETKAVERRGVDLALAAERRLGRDPQEQAFNNKGFDILSTLPDGSTIRVEVKARLRGADDFFVTHNEVLTAKNAACGYRLALVSVHPDGPHLDEVRYLDDPFATTELGDFDSLGIRGDWDKTWQKGRNPY